MVKSDFEKRLVSLENVVKDFNEKEWSDATAAANVGRRKIHADVELLRLDANDPTFDERLDVLVSKLSLIPLKRKASLLLKLDSILRFCGLVSCFLTFASVLALPMLMLKPLDDYLVKKNVISANKMGSEIIKRFIGKVILQVYGMSYMAEGRDIKFFEENSVLLTFSHASNSDAFLLAGTTPVRNFALTKKELFCVPFFSWLAFACGGIPVDRKNRDKAISALNSSAQAVQDGHICISIAPEGTRSVTGQLGPFKKGAFYMWDELKCPVVPVVTYGAFDLYPRGSIISNTGHVRMRFLQPIMPDEASSRDEMSALVRRRMLEAIKQCPEDIGEPLTWIEKLVSLFTILSLFAIDVKLYYIVCDLAFNYFKLSTKEFVVASSALSIVITLGLYFYYTEIVHWKTFSAMKQPPLVEKKNM